MPASQKPTTLYLVEYVGLNPVLWLWLARARSHSEKVMYASGRPKVISWWKKRFAATDFEEAVNKFLQTADAHLQLYEFVEERTQVIEESSVFFRFRRFFSHQQAGPTLRRLLMRDGFNEWMLSLEVERRVSCGECVRFFPVRWRPFISNRCTVAWRAVPPSYRALLLMRQLMIDALLPLAIAMTLVIEALWRRGISLRSPRVQERKVAQKIVHDLPVGRAGDHELLYADGELHPSRILHIADAIDITRAARQYFDGLGSTVVCVPRLRLPAVYFLRRVVWHFLFRLVIPCGLIALLSRTERDILLAAVKIGWQVINFEVFTQHHRVSVYLTWETYEVMCNVRTMVWEQVGTRCVGYIHGSPPMPLSYYHGVYVHTLLVAGERIRDMFGRTLGAAGQVIAVGHMHTELALGLKQEDPRSGHLVVAFDSSFSPMWGLSKDVLCKFYLGLLELVKAFPELSIYLKRKYRSSLQPNSAYAEVETLFEEHPRIKVFYERQAYSLLAEADSVVAIAVSTTGIEALACRKPTVFFDTRPNYADNPYRHYHQFLVCHTSDELLGRYARILAGDYPTEVIGAVVRRESKFCDERPLSYVRQLLLAQAGQAFDLQTD